MKGVVILDDISTANYSHLSINQSTKIKAIEHNIILVVIGIMIYVAIKLIKGDKNNQNKNNNGARIH